MKSKLTLIATATLGLTCAVLTFSAQSASAGEVKNKATAGCLDSDTQGKVYTKDCKPGNPYQRWEFSSDKGGVYKNEATGLCLDSNNNSDVYTFGCADRYAGQKWDS
jgi:hypothetical protein